MKNVLLMLSIAISLTLIGCDKPKEDPAEPAAAPSEPAPPEAPKEEAVEAPAAKIEVAAAGAKLDPAVKPEQLPDGAWYCDMGTVHWAAMEKPADGKCPECGMALKEYASADHAAQEAKAIEAKPHEHGHEHGEHGHEH